MAAAPTSWPPSERAGFIAALASVGPTFQPGLLPRRRVDQTLATGVVGAVNYGIVTTSQAGVRAVVRSLGPLRGRAPGDHAELLAALSGVGAGLAGWALGQRPTVGPVLPTLGRRLARSSLIALIAAAADELAQRLPASTPGWVSPSGRPMAALAGSALAALHIHHWRGSALTGPDAEPRSTEFVRCAAQGAALSAGLIGLGKAEHALARHLATILATTLPTNRAGRDLAAALANATVLAATTAGARGYVHRSALASQAQNTELEPGYAQPPHQVTVSGGPASHVPFATLSLEGRRFVHRVTSPGEIAQVMETTTPAMATRHTAPVRVYIGLQSATTPNERVDLALAELDTLGGFDRGTLCVAVPAGTGYVNPVAIQALEYLTGGDCATVAVQYSLRRSYYSLNRVAISAQQNRVLLAALTERIKARPPEQRPRLLLYGESLGALAAQQSLDGDGVTALERAGVERALFAGTPSSAAWARRWRSHPDTLDPDGRIVEVASRDEWTQLPPDRRDPVRVVLLSHHDDPVTIFDRGLLVRPARAKGLTQQAKWRPFTSYVLTAVDLKNAMNNDPNRFTTTGHDYRGDLARFVALAFGFDVDEQTLDRIETALRKRPIDVP